MLSLWCPEQDLLSDSNPMVVANAVASLADIRETSTANVLNTLTNQSLFKLLRALNECTEWGQVIHPSLTNPKTLLSRL